jgi:hypothetical protein
MRELGVFIEQLCADRGASAIELERARASNAASLEQWYAKSEAREVAAVTALKSVLDEADVRSVLDEMVNDIEQWYTMNQHSQLEAALQNAVMLLECERNNKDDSKAHNDDVSVSFF